MTSKTKRAFRATTPIARTSVEAHLEQLVDKAFAGPLSIGRIAQLMRGTPQDYARLGNLPPVVEGIMLEQAITLLAATNAEVMIFSGHSLPVSEAAFERVRITLGGKGHTTPVVGHGQRNKGYEPDLVSINPTMGVAHVIDIKRNLSSYDSPRLSHLKHRMFAAAYGLPALLARTGTNIAVNDIRIALLAVEGTRQDVENGIWSLAGLDQLIDVPGAAAVITKTRATFARRVDAQFTAATQTLIEDAVRERSGTPKAGLPAASSDLDQAKYDGGDGEQLSVGFARLPDSDDTD